MRGSNKPNIDFAAKEYITSQQSGIFPLVATGGTYQDVGVGLTLTISKTGLYKITCKTHADITYTTNNQNSAVLRLAHNGAEITGTVTQPYKNTAAIAGSFVFPISIEAPLQMFTAGDVIALQGYKTNTDVLNVFANAVYQGFIQAEMISAYVNTIPSITDWQSYVSAITNGTKGGGTVTDIAYYRKVVDILEIIYKYRQITGGVAGSSYYEWSMPPGGYTIDTARCPYDAHAYLGHVGDGFVYDGTEYNAKAMIISNSAWRCMRGGATLAWIGNTVTSLASANWIMSMYLRIPIVV